MPRPPILNPKRFDRRLTDEQLNILLVAGAGDTTKGFTAVLDCYQKLYNAGVNNDDKLDILLSDIRKTKT
jgi:hypothetical protein